MMKFIDQKMSYLSCKSVSLWVVVALLPVLPLPVKGQWFGENIDVPDASSPSSAIDAVKASRSERQRAVNLARSAVVRLNGGLSVYRPDKCMFSSEAKGCLIKSDSRGFLFVFDGGRPGWQQLGLGPTYQTKILVSPDGRSVSRIVYNRRY